MFKDIKLQAKNILKDNFKQFLIPSSLLMAFHAIVNIILTILTNYHIMKGDNSLIELISLVMLLLIVLICIPIVVAYISKVCFSLINSHELHRILSYKEFLNKHNIKRIIMINLLPSIMFLLYTVNKAEYSSFNVLRLDGISLAILFVPHVFTQYKFFACNYCFAASLASPKEVISSSFKLMKKNFFRYLLLCSSFILWDLLIVGIYFVLCIFLNKIFHIYNEYVGILYSFEFGLGFYLYPYRYLTFSIFINELKIKDK